MNITVDYRKRQYGLGRPVRKYRVMIREVSGICIENPQRPVNSYYPSREVEIVFRADEAGPGRGLDSWADSSTAEVLGGRIELSHDAARQLAQSILQFLDDKANPGQPGVLNFAVAEKPEPQEKKS
jgi:hypothetical protein